MKLLSCRTMLKRVLSLVFVMYLILILNYMPSSKRQSSSFQDMWIKLKSCFKEKNRKILTIQTDSYDELNYRMNVKLYQNYSKSLNDSVSSVKNIMDSDSFKKNTRDSDPSGKNIKVSVSTVKKSSSVDLKFHDFNVSGAYSFRNVCIETITDPISRNISCRIVVYDNFHGSGETYTQNLTTDSSWFTRPQNKWTVHFASGPIPKQHQVLPASAFFVGTNFVQNIYHFWNDLFILVFSVLKSTNRFHAGMKNQVLYNSANLSPDHPKYGHWIFEDILQTLAINKFQDQYYKLPTNTCYSSAVIGGKNTLERNRDAVDHVLRSFKIIKKSEEKLNDSAVIIKRENRRILNIDELERAAKAVGFKNVRVVSFEKISLKEQLTIAASTRLMVGVSGAGLQWSIFMPPGSTVLEFSWPQKYWYPFYGFVQTYDINYINMNVTDVRVNWGAFEKKSLNGQKCSKTRQLELLNMTHAHMWKTMNIWKHADISVDVDAFSKILKELIN